MARGAYIQGCQFSDFSLISDFFRIKETGIRFLKYSQNMYTISIVSKDRLDSDKGLFDNHILYGHFTVNLLHSSLSKHRLPLQACICTPMSFWH